jgi:peptidoglycan hydrolase-like protein with peptidoglycan-binding domain
MIRRATLLAMGIAALSGCATNPQEAVIAARPSSLPVKNLTNFSEPLRCMDRLFLSYGVEGLTITSAGIPDETGSVAAGTKDMLISSISRMSRKSEAFTFVDYDAQQTDVHDLQGLLGFTDEFVIPNYYIRGAITQLDEGVLNKAANASIAYQNQVAVEDEVGLGTSGFLGLGAGASFDETISVVSLDLNMGFLSSRQILSGASAQNSIAVAQRTVDGGIAGTISKVGLNFNVALNKGEGLHQAVRTLVELSTIEVLGRLTEVPYWRCLEIDHANPAIIAESREWFEDMDEEDRVDFVQYSLASSGYYTGETTGELDDETREAIGRYQAANDLIADTNINFDLYASLLNNDYSFNGPPAETIAHVKTGTTRSLDVEEASLELDLESDSDDDGNFALNSELTIWATPSLDAHVYCYYADANGLVSRIFPNRFQPNSYLTGGDSIQVPGDEAGFDIYLDRASEDEEVACVASSRELALRLPEAMKQQDLTAIPVASIDDVIDAYRDLEADDLVEARMDVTVR